MTAACFRFSVLVASRNSWSSLPLLRSMKRICSPRFTSMRAGVNSISVKSTSTVRDGSLGSPGSPAE